MDDYIMKDLGVTSIFATPIYKFHLNREFTLKELEFIVNLPRKSNIGNLTTKNTYVLESEPLSKIKSELMFAIHTYMDNVLKISPNQKPYITQSWLNFTDRGEYHHKHNHTNSIISGVLYINADPENDRISFVKEQYQQIKPNILAYNEYNCDKTNFDVSIGTLLLFPSSLNHMVETKIGENSRISLSFNVFLKGNIGESQSLNELIL